LALIRRLPASALLLIAATLLTTAGCGGAVTSASVAPSAPSVSSPNTAEPVPGSSAAATSTPGPSEATSVGDAESWISYQWGADGDNEDHIFLMRPDGTGQHELVPDLAGSDFHPDWSPDGLRVAFIHYAPGERSELWVVDADGSDAAKLLSCVSPCNEFAYPDWSPDGTAIYYGWSSNGVPGQLPTTFGIGRYDFATAKATDVLARKDGMTAEQPRVSPDGTRVVYDRGAIDGSGPGIGLFVSDVKGGPERQLTDWKSMAAHPDWAGDDRVIFNSYDLGFFQDTEEASNLYSIKADGTDLRQLTTFGRSDTRVTQPRMTPDGSEIVVTRVDGPGWGTRMLAIINIDGTGLRGLTPSTVLGTHPQLRPPPR